MNKHRTPKFVSDLSGRRGSGQTQLAPFKLEPLEKRLMLSGDPLSAAAADLVLLGDGIDRLEEWMQSFHDDVLSSTAIQGFEGFLGDHIDLGALLNYALIDPMAKIANQGADLTAEEIATDLEALLDDDLSEGWDVSGTRGVTIASETIGGETRDVLTLDFDLSFSKIFDWEFDFGDALENVGLDEYDHGDEGLAGYGDDDTSALSILADIDFDFTLKFALSDDVLTSTAQDFYIVNDAANDEVTISLSADQTDGEAANTQLVDFGVIVTDTDNDGDITNNQHMMARVEGAVTFSAEMGADLDDAIDANDDDLISYAEMGDATDVANPNIFSLDQKSSAISAEISLKTVFDIVDIEEDDSAAEFGGLTTILFDDSDLFSNTSDDLAGFEIVNVGDETTATIHSYGELHETVLFYPTVIQEMFEQVSALAGDLADVFGDLEIPLFGDVFDVISDAVQGIEDATQAMADLIEASGLSADHGELAAPIAAMRDALYTALSALPALPAFDNITYKTQKIITSKDQIQVKINDDKTGIKVFMNLDYQIATIDVPLNLDAMLGGDGIGIGFETDGTFETDFGAMFNIAFGFGHEQDGLTKDRKFFIGNDETFFDAEDAEPIIDVYLNAGFSEDFEIDAQLGWLGVTVVDILDQTDSDNGFNQIYAGDNSIDLIDDDQTVAEFHAYLELNYTEEDGFTTSHQLVGEANASLTINLRPLEVAGDWFPDFGAILNATWEYDSLEEDGSQHSYNVSMDHVWMRLGEVFSTVVNTLTTVPGTDINIFNMILDPLQPVFDVYSSPIPVLDDLGVDISLEQILKDANEVIGDPRVEALIHLLDLLGFLAEAQPFGDDNIPMYLGSFGITPSDPTKLETVEQFGNLEDNLSLDQQEFLFSQEGEYSSESGKGFYIPLLDNPLETLWEVFLGNDIDLFAFDLSFELVLSNRAGFDNDSNSLADALLDAIGGPIGDVIEAVMKPPVGLSAGVEFSFEFDLDFQIGYDTKGIREIMNGGDFEDIFDGFYIGSAESRDKTATINIGAYIGLSAELSAVFVGGGASGGLDLDFTLSVNDLDGDNRLRFNEIQTLFEFNPLYLFTMEGSAYAEFNAYFWVGIKIKIPFIGTIEKKLWSDSWNLGRAKLFYFKVSLPDDLVAPDLGVKLSDLDADAINFDTSLLNEFDTLRDDATDDEILLLYMGEAHEGRGKYFNGDDDENFTVEMIEDHGDGTFNVKVTGVGFEQEFENIRHIVGFGGEGADEIEIIGMDEGQAAALFFSGGNGDDTITAAEEAAIIVYGGAGNDTIYGSNQADIIYGGNDNDTIYGADGDDYIHAGDGSDLIFGEGGNDTITTGGGTIELPVDGSVTYMNEIYGGAGNDIITGGGANDDIDGGLGDDYIMAGDGYDRILGGEGNDRIHGGDHDDYISGDAGEDFLMGGDGNDLLLGEAYTVVDDSAYSSSGDVEYVQVGDGEADFIVGGLGNDEITGGGGTDALFGDMIEAIFQNGATSYTVRLDDEFFDSANFGSDAFFEALGLTDIVKVYSDNLTQGGDDTIVAGAGDDLVIGGVGSDSIYGDDEDGLETGNDTIFGDNASVVLFYSDEGTGAVLSVRDASVTDGNGGNDTIIGGLGDDVIIAGAGADSVTDLSGDNILFGDNATLVWSDTLAYWEQITSSDEAISSVQTDLNGADLSTITDKDVITAGTGDDLIVGGVGIDEIVTGGGNDVASGDGLSYAHDGVDLETFTTIDLATDGDDQILSAFAGVATVLLIGGGNADTLIAQSGRTILVGDSATISRKDMSGSYEVLKVDSVANSNGGDDTIIGSSAAETAIGGEGADTLLLSGGNNIILGDNGVINNNTGDANAYSVATYANVNGGNDSIYAEEGDDYILAGDGNDSVFAGDGENVVFGDTGTIQFTSAGRFESAITTITDYEGDDELHGGADEDTFFAGGGDDELYGYDGSNILLGDWAEITQAGVLRTLALGTGGDDQLHGGANADIILAGGGDDEIYGYNGTNILAGDWAEIDEAGNIRSLDLGTGGSDDIYGGDNQDIILGGGGALDEIYAGSTDTMDIVFGDGGTVSYDETTGLLESIVAIEADDGNDEIYLSDNALAFIFGGDGEDEIYASSGDFYIFGDRGRVQFTETETVGSVETIDHTVGDNDAIIVSDASAVIAGGHYADTIIAQNMQDAIIFGDFGTYRNNDETLAYEQSVIESTTEDGHGGSDQILLDTFDHAVIIGGAGHDEIYGSSGSTLIAHGDEAVATIGVDLIETNSVDGTSDGSDSIEAEDIDLAILSGGDGSDQIMAATDAQIERLYVSGDLISARIESDAGTFETIEASIGGFDSIYVGDADYAVVAGGSSDDDILVETEYASIVSGDQLSVEWDAENTVEITVDATEFDGQDIVRVSNEQAGFVAGGGGLFDHIYVDGSDLYTVIFGDSGQAVLEDYAYITQAVATYSVHEGMDIITAEDGHHVIMGGGSDDMISAVGGNQIVFGDYGQVAATDDETYFDEIASINPEIGGHDLIYTGAGDDIVIGGQGDDDISGFTGNDILIGDNGEIYREAEGTLTVTSTSTDIGGHDYLSGDAGMDILIGGAGTDLIEAGDDNDVLFGDNGTIHSDASGITLETIAPEDGASDELYGGDGNDYIFGGTHTEETDGLAESYAGFENFEEFISGGNGHDTIFGDGGYVGISYGATQDIIITPKDVFYGDNDLIYGGLGDDVIIGGAGNDDIDGFVADVAIVPTFFTAARGGPILPAPSSDGPAVPPILVPFPGSGTDVDADEWGDEPHMDDVRLDTGVTVSPKDFDLYVGEFTPDQGDGADLVSTLHTYLAIADGIGVGRVDGTDNDYIIGDVGEVIMKDGVPVTVGATSGEIGGDDYLVGNIGDDVIIAGAGSDFGSGNDGEDVLFSDYGLVIYDELGRKRRMDASIFYNGGQDTLIAGLGRDYVFGQGGEEDITIDWELDFTVGFNGYVDLDENGIVINSAGGDSTLTTDQLSSTVEGGRFSAIPEPASGPTFFEVRDVPEVGSFDPFSFELNGEESIRRSGSGSSSAANLNNIDPAAGLNQISPEAGDADEEGEEVIPENLLLQSAEQAEAASEETGEEGVPAEGEQSSETTSETGEAADAVEPAAGDEATENDVPEASEEDPSEPQEVEEEEEEEVSEAESVWPEWALAAE